MKKSYLITNLKSMLLISMCLLSIFFVFAQSPVETTVFKDDFNGTFPVSGNPETNYMIVKQTVSGTDPDDPFFQDGVLRINAPKSSVTRNGVFGNLSVYSTPFASKLSEISADSIAWTFNMRANRGTTSGFDDADFGIATVLVADAANYTAANGYAVVSHNIGGTRCFRLAKFANGLNADEKFTNLIDGLVGDALTYATIRIVFVKSSNTWKFYGRADSGAFTDPSQGLFTLLGSAVDDTFVNTSMSHFGFFMMCKSYSTGSTSFYADNLAVKTYITVSGVSQYEVDKLFQTNLLPGAIKIETPSATATLYDVTGAVLHTAVIDGKTTIRLSKKGFYVLKVNLSDGRSGVKKFFID